MNNKVEEGGFLDPTIDSGTQVDGLQYYTSYYYNHQTPNSGYVSSYRFKLYVGYEQ
ncbi:MAG: hypothetical protein SPJ17_03385 [Anaeroplasma sp.]|uniref:hypothetical protein n=1 Tax=Anaeroplasma sp. TaxID=1872523 RepID=UPI002A91D9E8|nr:hypothetical protein [Anaeroplasma sp.]MDY5982713.1 hypothetical protein [Anaeroplasma sp.]